MGIQEISVLIKCTSGTVGRSHLIFAIQHSEHSVDQDSRFYQSEDCSSCIPRLCQCIGVSLLNVLSNEQSLNVLARALKRSRDVTGLSPPYMRIRPANLRRHHHNCDSRHSTRRHISASSSVSPPLLCAIPKTRAGAITVVRSKIPLRAKEQSHDPTARAYSNQGSSAAA